MEEQNIVWATITVEMERKQIAALYRFCADHLITVDELTNRILCWLIDNPDEAKVWIKEHMEEKESEKISEHA